MIQERTDSGEGTSGWVFCADPMFHPERSGKPHFFHAFCWKEEKMMHIIQGISPNQTGCFSLIFPLSFRRCRCGDSARV